MAIKKWLKAFVGWLDRKFPDKIIVTVAEYELLNARIKKIEAEMTKFNISLGFGAGYAGVAQPRPFER